MNQQQKTGFSQTDGILQSLLAYFIMFVLFTLSGIIASFTCHWLTGKYLPLWASIILGGLLGATWSPLVNWLKSRMTGKETGHRNENL